VVSKGKAITETAPHHTLIFIDESGFLLGVKLWQTSQLIYGNATNKLNIKMY
jgi:hypothetical protein